MARRPKANGTHGSGREVKPATRIKLDLRGVSKFYGSGSNQVLAVDDLDLSIAEGEMVTLLGPSGCGKTTTLRMVAGFEQVSNGSIWIDGADVTAKAPNERPTGMVFQNYALFPHKTVSENIEYGLRFGTKMGAKERKEKVESICKMLGLSDKLDRYPGEMSGGQQQRVALGRAMVVEPRVLLFDEPLSNLDAQLREGMRKEIREVQRRTGLTSMYVTHDQTEAMAISDRVVVMNNGKVEQSGTPEEIYSRPSNKFVASFIGRASFLQVNSVDISDQIARLHLFGSDFSVSSRPGDKKNIDGWLVVRPEAVGVSRAIEGQGVGVVKEMTFLGPSYEYVISTDHGTILASVSSSNSEGALEPGTPVQLRLDPVGLHFLTE